MISPAMQAAERARKRFVPASKPQRRTLASLSRKGSRADNNLDMKAKGREQRGERHHCARLTASDARAIRARYEAGEVSQRKLAEEFGVGQQTISALLRGQTWRHV